MHPRPSNLGRLALCPGSYVLALQIWRDQPPAQAVTTSGARIHRALWQGDYSQLSAEEQEVAHQCSIYETELLERWGATTAFHQGLLSTVAREVPLKLLGESGDVILDGTPDALADWQAPDGRHGGVLDFKTGWRFSPTSLACQCGAYGAMVLQTFPDMLDVSVAGYYPRLRADFVRVFRRDELPGLISSIKAILEEATHSDEIRLRPSAEACEYCPALNACPAVRQSVLSLERAIQALDISALEGPRLGDLYSRLGVLEDLKAAVRDEIIARHKEGDNSTGYVGRLQQGHRYIADVGAAWDRVGDIVPAVDFLGCCDVRYKRLEEKGVGEIRRRKGPKYKVKEAQAEFQAILGDALQRRAPFYVLTRLGAVEAPKQKKEIADATS